MGQQVDTKESLRERVMHDLTLHPPKSDEASGRMDRIRAAAKEFANVLIDEGTCPSRELSMALSDLESVVYNANASVARHQS